MIVLTNKQTQGKIMKANNGVYKTSFFQHTLKNSFTCVSRGLHTGLNIIMRVIPAEANSGIIFVRRDIGSPYSEIQANWKNVTDTRLSTTIANSNGVRVSTIEHLMAALYASGIDNARIVIDGPEVPIMDGSAAPFVKLINHVGKIKQNCERRAIVIKQATSVSNGDKFAGFTPFPIPFMKVEIDFDSASIGQQTFAAVIDEKVFENELASARTFGFKEQVSTLHKLGLAQGGSLNNAVLVENGIVVNKEGLRYKDEFVRHKMVDSIGDVALAGARVIGKFTGVRNGHQLNNELIQKLMVHDHTWEYTTVREANKYWQELLQSPYSESNMLVEN